jgi:hypothetical protein
MRRRTRFKLVAAALAMVLALVIAEVGLRLAGYGPRPWGATPAGYFWVVDRELGFANRPLGAYRNRSIVGEPLVTTDRHGFRRGLGWAADEGQPKVAMVGDSTTFCAEVDDDQTVASELARRLGSGIGVVNAGVCGYSTVQAMRMLGRCLERFPSLEVAVLVLCGNDLVENLNPIVYYPAWAPTVRWDPTQQVLVEVEPEVGVSQIGRPVAPAEVSRLHLALFRLGKLSALARLIEAGVRRVASWPPVYVKRLALDSGAVGPVFAGTPAWDEQVQWALDQRGDEALQLLLQQMDAMCRERGVVLLTTAFTAGGRAGGGPISLAQISRRAGVRYLDLSDAFPGSPSDYRAVRVTGELDPHYGPAGTAAFADALAPVVAAVLEGEDQAAGAR